MKKNEAKINYPKKNGCIATQSTTFLNSKTNSIITTFFLKQNPF